MIAGGNTAPLRARLIELMRDHTGPISGDSGLDETLELIRAEYGNFDERVAPHAEARHLRNNYIPLEMITQMARSASWADHPRAVWRMGLGKESMCVVSEELSRGYIGVGSARHALGNCRRAHPRAVAPRSRSAKRLPKIASGEVLPTAVFTEPNVGSDLASLKTRAVRDGDTYKVHGNKTWITHPVRADLMTLLVRTNPQEPGYRGLSMLLAEKPRGTDADPFPAPGMSGPRSRCSAIAA